MMKSKLDYTTIRDRLPADLAAYLRTKIQTVDSNSISAELLATIASEASAPTVFSTWLSVCHDPTAVADALSQQHSIFVRRQGILYFGKWLRSVRVSEVWTAAGGTKGLLEFLAKASVNEVKLFCKVVGRTGTTLVVSRERRELVTELVTALAHEHFPDAKYSNVDRRPLIHHYADMVPACTAEFAEAWMASDSLPVPDAHKLIMAHPDLSRSQCLEDAKRHGQEKTDLNMSWYTPLFTGLPPLATLERGVSESMVFSVTLLQKTTAYPRAVVDPSSFHEYLALPLVRRLWLRRCSTTKRLEMLDVLREHFTKHAGLAKSLRLEQDGIIAYIVRMWSRQPDRLQGMLIAILDMLPAVGTDLGAFYTLLDLTRYRLRLPLLKLLLSRVKSFHLDIDSDEQLKKSTLRWPVQLLLALPRLDAYKLLQRLVRLRPEGHFLQAPPRTSVFMWHAEDDPRTLSLYLSRSQPGAAEQGQAAVEGCKKKASTSREQADRALWAKSAIFCAIASGSMDLYRDVLLWARRYNRDALTVKQLYASSTVQTVEGLDLLCGIPERPHASVTTVEDVERDVRKGSDICMLLLNTACEALREPSFYASDWSAVLTLYKQVVQMRLVRVNKLQDALGLSDEETYRTVWRPTLETCIALERLGHQDGHENLGFNRAGGPLQAYSGSLTASGMSQASFRFVDELARHRDELWQGLRKAIHPDVVTLQSPWPRGLPIQLLLPVDLIGNHDGYDLPYSLSHAKDVVFLEREAAFGPAEYVSEAIESFVESWQSALTLYVNAAPKGPRRQHRADQAWQHALGDLTGSRMSAEDAVRFWQKIFTTTGIETTFAASRQPRQKPDPYVPQVDEPTQPTEWNPDPDPELYGVKSRTMNVVALDCLLNSPALSFSASRLNTRFRPVPSRTVAVQQPAFWHGSYGKAPSPNARDAQIAAALLFINSKRCPSHRLLAQPFPTAESARFPALYLDDDFLDRKDLHTASALSALQVLGGTVPLKLLQELARAMFDELKRGKKPGQEHDTFALLKLLATSDRPYLALGMIKELVLDRPDDSSWHRQLLSKGLFNRLPAAQARDFWNGFSSDIEAKLERQSQVAVNGTTGEAVATKPAVKVTTVKMVAQMMTNVDFVDQHCTVDILIGLFARARHLDIRVAIVESLVTMLTATQDAAVKARIYASLEEHAIPIAAALNERYPMTDEEWGLTEKDLEVPDVYMVTNSQEPAPVLQALLSACQHGSNAVAEDQGVQILTRLVLPILDKSAANNRRWMQRFIRKHHFDVPISELPAVPVKLLSLTILLSSFIQWMPSSVFDTYADFITTSLQPPKWLQDVTTRVLEDVELRSSNAGQHWLSLWNVRGIAALAPGGQTTASFLRGSWTSRIAGGVTSAHIQQHLLKHADILVLADDADFTVWSSFQRLMEPRLHHREEEQRCYYEYIVPVIRQIVQRIDSLRTAQWQRNPTNPTVLPDTFLMHLWLLTYPSMPWMPDHAKRRDTFVSEVSDAIEQLGLSQRPYHERFLQVQSAVKQIYDSDYAYIAVALSSATRDAQRDLSLADYLRVELAGVLIQGAAPPKDTDIADQVKSMIHSWRSSADEDIRMLGIRTLNRFAKPGTQAGSQKQAWLRELMQ